MLPMINIKCLKLYAHWHNQDLFSGKVVVLEKKKSFSTDVWWGKGVRLC